MVCEDLNHLLLGLAIQLGGLVGFLHSSATVFDDQGQGVHPGQNQGWGWDRETEGRNDCLAWTHAYQYCEIVRRVFYSSAGKNGARIDG